MYSSLISLLPLSPISVNISYPLQGNKDRLLYKLETGYFVSDLFSAPLTFSVILGKYKKRYSIFPLAHIYGVFSPLAQRFICVCFLFLWCPPLYPTFWSSRIDAPLDQAHSVSQQVLQHWIEDLKKREGE